MNTLDTTDIFEPRPHNHHWEYILPREKTVEFDTQRYEKKPDDFACHWYTDLANYNAALYQHWRTKDVYAITQLPLFQFCGGSDTLEDSLGYGHETR